MFTKRSSATIRRPRKVGGFSLIELIAIIVILAILSAGAVPAISHYTNRNAAAAANELHDNLAYARQRALASGRTNWVQFQIGENRWVLLEENPQQPGKANAGPIPDPATGRAMTTPLGTGAFATVNLTSAQFDGQNEIGFDWLGRPLNASETLLQNMGVVQLTGNRQVHVTPLTGRIETVMP